MKHFPLLFILTFFIHSYSNSQTTFIKTYGGNNEDRAFYSIETSDGNYLIAGDTESGGNGSKDGYLLKIDDNGNELWSKTYGGSQDDRFRDIVELSNNDIIISGFTKSYGQGGFDIWLMRLDAFGNVIWSKTYGSVHDDIPKGILLTSDNHILVSAQEKTSNSNLNIIALKLDLNGQTIWHKKVGDGGNDYPNSPPIENPQGYVFAGSRFSGSAFGQDELISQFSTSGSLSFSKLYRGNENDGIRHISTDGNTTFTQGESWSWISEHSVTLSRLDNNLDQNWSKIFYINGKNIDGSKHIIHNGHVYLTAFDHTQNNISNTFIIKVDLNGNIIWAKEFGSTPNTMNRFYNIAPTSDGGLIAVGFSNSYSGNNDIFIVKIDTNGNINDCNIGDIPILSSNISPSTASYSPSENNLSQGIIGTINPSNASLQCQSICSSINIPNPITSFSQTASEICENGCIMFQDSSTENPSSWEWQIDGNPIIPSTNTLEFCFENNGIHEVILFSCNDNGCDSDTSFITVNELPDISLGADTIVCIPDNISLNAQASPGASYLWSEGSTTSSISVDNTGLYWVEVNLNNCINRDSIQITFNDCCNVVTPNVFTPNEDGFNDNFIIFSNCEFTYFELHIFDRWGEVIYVTKNPSEGWNGRFKGMNMPAEVYVWYLKYQTNQSHSGFLKGDLTLVR